LGGRGARAGGGGGEGDRGAVGLGAGLVGAEADGAAADELVGQVLDRVVAHRFGLVSDVDLDVVAAGAPGVGPGEGIGRCVVLLDHPRPAAGLDPEAVAGVGTTGGGGGERDRGARGAWGGRVGAQCGSGAGRGVEDVGEAVHLLVCVRTALVADVDLEAVV